MNINKKYPIISKLLKEHEKYGLTHSKILIKKEIKKITLMHLKIFLVSIGGKSEEARKFFKENYIVE